MYEKRTLRKMKPVQRRLAIQCNEIERVQRRLRRLVEEVAGVEQEVLLWEAADSNDRDNLVGMLRLPCRLVSLHLRRGTPVAEIVDQIRGIQEMQPWPNQFDDGTTVYVHGLGDAIAHVLKGFLKSEEEVEATEAKLAA